MCILMKKVKCKAPLAPKHQAQKVLDTEDTEVEIHTLKILNMTALLQMKEQLQHNGREDGPASDPVWKWCQRQKSVALTGSVLTEMNTNHTENGQYII
jgi:hypothetical protein